MFARICTYRCVFVRMRVYVYCVRVHVWALVCARSRVRVHTRVHTENE